MGLFSDMLSLISKPDSSKMSAIAGLLFVGAVGVYAIDACIKERQSTCLRSVIPLRELKELGERLNNSTKSLTVMVSGKVHSDVPTALSPLRLEMDDFLSVICEGKTEIIYEDRDCKGDQFSSLKEFASIRQEVSWYLVDDTDRVRVVGIQQARGFDAHKREVASPGSTLLKDLPFVRELDDRRGIKVLGVKHTECALKVDCSLTVVGKAVKEDSGDITIDDLLFVCQSDKFNETKAILFDHLSAWQIVSMCAFVTSLVILVVEGAKVSA